MKLSAFLDLVEIKTKAASVIPFLFGAVYAYYRFQSFDVLGFSLMLVSLLAFDMATTAINNYMDFVTAKQKSGYGYEEHNAVSRYGLRKSTALVIIFVLLLLGAGFGIALVFRTNVGILVLGALCAFIGVLYSAAPLPISSTPYGEVFSGVTMGFLITFIAVCIHTGGRIFSVQIYGSQLEVDINLMETVVLFLLCLPLMTGIANIMLANNICDMAEDKANYRLTLPLWLGEHRALIVFAGLYMAGYLGTGLAIVMGVVPWYYTFTLVSAVAVLRNVRTFWKRHVKAETFVLSVRNFVLINGINLLALLLCVAIRIRF